MLMKALNYTKPGYTRRPCPTCGIGTRLIRFCANHSIGLLVASVLTPLGLMRQSTGPAIKVKLFGFAGWSSSAMIATAASAATQG